MTVRRINVYSRRGGSNATPFRLSLLSVPWELMIPRMIGRFPSAIAARASTPHLKIQAAELTPLLARAELL